MRTATHTRSTAETSVSVQLLLEGTGRSDISTGIGFLDHMLVSLAKHARIDLTLRATGDLHIDDHHTAEDVAITLGEAFSIALADKAGVLRFGTAYAPLDEALARTVVDLSGRPYASVTLLLLRDSIGGIACENITHFFRSFATATRMTLHLDVLRGENDHHKAEAAFKSLALALRQAISISVHTDIPSTKGVL